MGKFMTILPDDVMKEVQFVNENSEMIFGGMTRKAAEQVKNNVMANLPSALKSSEFANNIKLTKTYYAPSYGGYATQVFIGGYFINENNKSTPAPLVANLFEYGSSKKEYPKQPFFWRSFSSQQIEATMLKTQRELSKGILE